MFAYVYVVGCPCAYFTAQNVLSRKNGHFKKALNMSTQAVKSIRFLKLFIALFWLQKGRYAKTHRNVQYILNGYLLFSKYAIIA